MRVLGGIFVFVGICLCLTFILLIPGLIMVGVGALCMIAGKKTRAA
jgi:hypothetical protein